MGNNKRASQADFKVPIKNKTGLYIHIPFCRKKCGYCDFYSVGYQGEKGEKYVDALIREFKEVSLQYPNYIIDSIYIGGGTPSVLPLFLMEKLISGILRNASFDLKEFTIEVNPCSSQNLLDYKSLGIDRISLGVQSLDDDILKIIGREHSSEEAIRALERAASTFDNVSSDMMIGLPLQNNDKIEKTIKGISSFSNHISMYILKLSDKVPMQKAILEGKMQIADDDKSADMYEFAYEQMKLYGYERYEISNFARENKISYHNMKYWTRENYIGIGAAAHSFLDGVRYENTASIDRYIKGENLGGGLALKTPISQEDGLFEEIMLGFRLKKGINITNINNKYNINFLENYFAQINKLKDILVYDKGYLSIKEDKILLESYIARMFL